MRFEDSWLRCRRPNDFPRLLADLAPFREELVGVAVESTYNGYWLVDGLMGHGYAVHLVNTTAIPQYDGLKHGDDDSDALHLARLVRLQSAPGIGPILGMTILLESGAIECFVSSDYASCCRMVESVRLSNGKRKGHGNRKWGNRYLC